MTFSQAIDHTVFKSLAIWLSLDCYFKEPIILNTLLLTNGCSYNFFLDERLPVLLII